MLDPIGSRLLPSGSAVNRPRLVLPQAAYDLRVGPNKTRLDLFQERLILAIQVAQKRERDLGGELSERAIERNAGLSSGQLRKWKIAKRGKRIGADTVRSLAMALKVREEWLRGDDVPMNAAATSLEEQALAGMPAVDSDVRTIVRSIYAKWPNTPADAVRDIVTQTQQQIVAVRGSQVRAKNTVRRKKSPARGRTTEAAPPKSRRKTGS